ncbi:hypothetical protein MY3296_007965 [Beauveria thailandica]
MAKRCSTYRQAIEMMFYTNRPSISFDRLVDARSFSCQQEARFSPQQVTKLSVEFFDGRTETFDTLISTGGIFGLFPRTHSKMAFQPTPLRRLGSATAGIPCRSKCRPETWR